MLRCGEHACLIAYEQIMEPVLLVAWHGFEHHPPQCMIVEGFQSNKMLQDIRWQTFECWKHGLQRCYEQLLKRLLCRRATRCTGCKTWYGKVSVIVCGIFLASHNLP
jgi:hypothetical protein